jgi:hypothetical protein
MRSSDSIEYIQTKAGAIPRVSARLSLNDHLGALMVRWSFNRNKYIVIPGIYAIGVPDDNSDVFVTANYKLSFDILRRNLDGLNAWILVLDTKGINVWCAAGKGTFGTEELVRCIKASSLDMIVNHRRVILPQLGAVGVAAHHVKKYSGFSVVYGPVKAADIKAFVKAQYKATEEMRRVNFTFTDRIKLTPVELMNSKYYLLGTSALFFIISGLNKNGISFGQTAHDGLISMLNILLAYFAGAFITPVLLPYIPGRSFTLKGFISGLLVCFVLLNFNLLGSDYLDVISWFLIITAISSFLAMNFTGASTYTSLSGVKKEMRIAVPMQISFSFTGLVLMIIGKFL